MVLSHVRQEGGGGGEVAQFLLTASRVGRRLTRSERVTTASPPPRHRRLLHPGLATAHMGKHGSSHCSVGSASLKFKFQRLSLTLNLYNFAHIYGICTFVNYIRKYA